MFKRQPKTKQLYSLSKEVQEYGFGLPKSEVIEVGKRYSIHRQQKSGSGDKFVIQFLTEESEKSWKSGEISPYPEDFFRELFIDAKCIDESHMGYFSHFAITDHSLMLFVQDEDYKYYISKGIDWHTAKLR